MPPFFRLFDVDSRHEARQRLRSLLKPVSVLLIRLRQRTLARKQRLVMVTGTQGKTTTTRCVRAALGLSPDPAVMVSPNRPRSFAPILLRQAPWWRHAVLEAAINRPGNMRELMDLLAPAVVVVTSVGTEHHRLFPSLAALRAEKAISVRLLPASGVAVLNGDDPQVASMAAETRARAVTYGTHEGVDVRATGVELQWPRGTLFTIEVGGRKHSVKTRLFGLAGVYSALGALAVAYAEGVPLSDANARLAGVPPTRRRNEPIRLANGAWALMDDAKAPPETVAPFLQLASQVPAGRRIFVLGKLDRSPGGEEAFYHQFGEAVGRMAALVVVAGEPDVAAKFAPGLAAGGLAAEQILHAPDALAAGELLRAHLREDDVVFVKGTGNLRLTRAALRLAGRDVRCRRPVCHMEFASCETCPLLSRAQDRPRRR
jgi:UDP-N-acetylmuramoyl-tripeptide--D-alanyl-D-alanine ligase